jgi:peptidoglycan/LPS O-acetylase OafA/YrhL
MLIVCSHLSILGFPHFEAGGDSGVAFFFILSGYLTMRHYGKALEQGDFRHKEYLLKHIRKIYPLFFLSWLMAVLLKHNVQDFLYALPSLLLIQSWIPLHAVYFGGNAVAWFLSVLLAAWLFLPLLYLIVSSRLGILVLLLLYSLYCYYISEDDINAWLYIFAPVRLVDFMLGMWLCKFVGNKVINTKESCCLFLFGTLCMVAAIWFYHDIEPHVRNAAIFWPSILMIIPTVSSLPPMLDKVMKQRWLVILSNYTLEIYLFHVIAFQAIAIIIGRYGLII